MLHNTTRKSKAQKIADLRFKRNGADCFRREWGLNENADWTVHDPICNLKSEILNRRQSAFFRINVGTSKSSARALMIGRGNSSGGRGM
jgi:hypothetical protein